MKLKQTIELQDDDLAWLDGLFMEFRRRNNEDGFKAGTKVYIQALCQKAYEIGRNQQSLDLSEHQKKQKK